MQHIILASSSQTRADLLRNAGLVVEIQPARIDEDAIKASLLADEVSPRDISDALAEAKAAKVGGKNPGALVIGCDQVLECDGVLYSKPEHKTECLGHLSRLSGKTHQLWSAAVVVENAKPVWRHISRADLTMRTSSDTFLQDYVERNWDSLRTSVGGYKLEEEGVRLFSKVRGDYFSVLGLPLVEILSWLTLRGTLAS